MTNIGMEDLAKLLDDLANIAGQTSKIARKRRKIYEKVGLVRAQLVLNISR